MNNVATRIFPFSSIHRFLPIILGLMQSHSVAAQNFDYSFAKDSVAWQELNTQTILNANDTAWKFSYNVPIGFSFNYLGKNFDSLRIETNGYLVFDADRDYALTSFLGFGDCVDSLGHHSVLGYELSGGSGNHVLKIQFKNTSISPVSDKHFTYQLWLKENGTLEVHVGPNDYETQILISTTEIDSLTIEHDTTIVNPEGSQSYRIGIMNMNMDQPTNGYFVGGSIDSPQGIPVNEANPEPALLLRAPSYGTRFTFTPNSN